MYINAFLDELMCLKFSLSLPVWSPLLPKDHVSGHPRLAQREPDPFTSSHSIFQSRPEKESYECNAKFHFLLFSLVTFVPRHELIKYLPQSIGNPWNLKDFYPPLSWPFLYKFLRYILLSDWGVGLKWMG